jgi:2-oxoglutarate ferredoxin oxidoreductase subunit gamma
VLSHEAATRFIPEMSPAGILLVEQDLVEVPDLPAGVRVFRIPATRMAEELGKKIVMNVIVVGFFAAVTKLLPKEAFLRAIEDSAPATHRELNLRAFEAGYSWSQSNENQGSLLQLQWSEA